MNFLDFQQDSQDSASSDASSTRKRVKMSQPILPAYLPTTRTTIPVIVKAEENVDSKSPIRAKKPKLR
jgi:hypothetical protein